MNDGALIDGVVRIDYLRPRKSEEGINGDEDDTDRIVMNGASPLKVVVGGDGKGSLNESFPEGREGSIIGLVDEGEIGVANLETSQKSVIPSGKIYIRVGYKGSGESEGGKGVGIGLRGIRHTRDRLLVCQQNQYLVIKDLRENPLLRFSL